MPSGVLDTSSIVESAGIASGTSGLVDTALRERIDALAGWFRRAHPGEGDIAIATRRQLVRILARRLAIAGDIARHPAILAESVESPIFVIGFPRTGTSLLHALLGCDPASRSPRAWQVREPSPPPGAATVSDYRKQLAAADVQRFVERCPGLLVLHPYWDQGADAEIEDEEIFTLDFLNAYPSMLYDAASLAMMVSIGDGDGAYAFLRSFMQHQQWQLPRRRWVMKGVEHQRQLPALFRAFPDARCIWPHREPGEFLPSNLAIAAVVYDGITAGGLDRQTLADGYLDGFDAEIARLMDDPVLADPRIHHVRFGDVVTHPVETLRAAYGAWGLDFTPAAEQAMHAWLAADGSRSDRYGRHSYDFSDFGVDWTQRSGRYDGYRRRFLHNPQGDAR